MILLSNFFFKFIEDQIVYESKYHRERKIQPPIGFPSHCAIILQLPTFIGPSLSAANNSTSPDSLALSIDGKSNKTIIETSKLHCPSYCSVESDQDTVKVNKVSELSEGSEIAMPENVDVIETSTTYKTQKPPTTKLHPIMKKIDSIDLLKKNDNLDQIVNNVTEQKIVLPDVNTTLTTLVTAKNVNEISKIAVQVEQPIEVRDLSIQSLLIQTTTSKSISNGQDPNSVYSIQNKSNKTKDSSELNSEVKQQETEPIAISASHTDTLKFMENDIKTSFNKKTQSSNKFNKTLSESDNVNRNENIETMSKIINGNVDGLASTPAYEITADASTNSACFFIYLLIQSDSFNVTLGSDEICHNFNITYNIPLSKYMKENRFQLVFV